MTKILVIKTGYIRKARSYKKKEKEREKNTVTRGWIVVEIALAGNRKNTADAPWDGLKG